MNGPAATLEDAISTVASIGADATGLLGADGLLSFTNRLEELGRRVDGLRVAAATDIGQRSDPALGRAGLSAAHGFRTGSDLIEMVTGVSAATVRRRLRVGALIRPRVSDTGMPLPALFASTGEAMAAGLVGIDVADTITKELSTAAPRAAVDDVLAAERALLGQATGIPASDDLGNPMAGVPLPADLVRDQARTWRDALDQDGIEPRAEQARARRDFWISRTPHDGLHAIRGAVTSDVAAGLLAVFDTALSLRTAPAFDRDQEETERGLVADERTRGQQRADVFAAMIRDFGNSDTFATAPVVLTIIDANTLETGMGTGTMSGVTGRVPVSMIRQAVCDGGTQPVTLKAGRVQALGTAGRFFTAQQRRAIAARDGNTCVHPTCRIPATASEAHHVIPDKDGGPTHVDNGVLACWWHHHLLDTGIWTVTMTNGKPKVTVPDWLKRQPYTRT